jgi:hypothetical protein
MTLRIASQFMPANEQLLLTALSDAAGSLRSPAATFFERRS